VQRVNSGSLKGARVGDLVIRRTRSSSPTHSEWVNSSNGRSSGAALPSSSAGISLTSTVTTRPLRRIRRTARNGARSAEIGSPPSGSIFSHGVGTPVSGGNHFDLSTFLRKVHGHAQIGHLSGVRVPRRSVASNSRSSDSNVISICHVPASRCADETAATKSAASISAAVVGADVAVSDVSGSAEPHAGSSIVNTTTPVAQPVRCMGNPIASDSGAQPRLRHHENLFTPTTGDRDGVASASIALRRIRDLLSEHGRSEGRLR
jgi:hypothetical protein